DGDALPVPLDILFYFGVFLRIGGREEIGSRMELHLVNEIGGRSLLYHGELGACRPFFRGYCCFSGAGIPWGGVSVRSRSAGEHLPRVWRALAVCLFGISRRNGGHTFRGSVSRSRHVPWSCRARGSGLLEDIVALLCRVRWFNSPVSF